MPYNLTEVVRVNGTLEFIQNVNTELMTKGGTSWYGILILGAIFAIIFMAFVFSTGKPIKAFTAASFIAFGLSLLLFTVSLVPVIVVFFTIIASAIGIAFWNLD